MPQGILLSIDPGSLCQSAAVLTVAENMSLSMDNLLTTAPDHKPEPSRALIRLTIVQKHAFIGLVQTHLPV